jgi:hypothetical protein
MVAVGPVALDVGCGRTKEKADEIVRLFHDKAVRVCRQTPATWASTQAVRVRSLSGDA